MPDTNKIMCVICSEREATTYEHVPPKCIFPDPKPVNLITVPACQTCNNGNSKIDEQFKVLVHSHCATLNPQHSTLIDTALRTLMKNMKLSKQLLDSVVPASRITEAGIIHGKMDVINPDMSTPIFKNVIARMVRGLYWHHYKNPLPNKALLEISGGDIFTDQQLQEIFGGSSKNKIGLNNEVVYLHKACNTEPYGTAWAIEFYGVLRVMCITMPPRYQYAP